jgi:hypothetical protein
MEEKYPVLAGVAVLARVAGWIVLGIAGFIFLSGLFGLMGSYNPIDQGRSMLSVVSAIGIIPFAVMLILVGEAVKVFVDIEHNTAQIVVALGGGLTGITGDAATVSVPTASDLRIALGGRVMHNRFGVGVIVAMTDTEANVKFDAEKKVMRIPLAELKIW